MALPAWAQPKPTRKMKGTWGAWPDVVAKNASRLRAAEKVPKPVDFVLYGDSITAFLNGYSVSPKVPGSEQPWKTHFGDLNAVALGVAGDQISTVLWRVTHTEKPAVAPKIIGLHIGINDLIGFGLPKGQLPVPPTITRLEILITTLATMFPTTTILVFALTPCQGVDLRAKKQAHNAAAQKLVVALSAANKAKVVYADCATAAGIVDPATGGPPPSSGVLGDGVHMTLKGHDLHLAKMRAAVNTYLT